VPFRSFFAARRVAGASGLAAAIVAVVLAALHFAPLADAGALWHIVNDRCVPDQQRSGSPAPCLAVHIEHGVARGDAVLKDLRGVLQVLLIPTARLTGIESPELLAPDAPNYWQDAWDARRFMNQRHGAPLPRDSVALAINAKPARSQNQLHIHVSCVRRDLLARLREADTEIGPAWAPLPGGWMGHPYLARRLEGGELGSADPFKLVADEIPGARADMAQRTIAVIGARDPDGRDGFVILAGRADPAAGVEGSAEDDTQDHACSVLG
jgi:CDP-diacylglycerol pyrophosphatase